MFVYQNRKQDDYLFRKTAAGLPKKTKKDYCRKVNIVLHTMFFFYWPELHIMYLFVHSKLSLQFRTNDDVMFLTFCCLQIASIFLFLPGEYSLNIDGISNKLVHGFENNIGLE